MDNLFYGIIIGVGFCFLTTIIFFLIKQTSEKIFYKKWREYYKNLNEEQRKEFNLIVEQNDKLHYQVWHYKTKKEISKKQKHLDKLNIKKQRIETKIMLEETK